MIPGENKLIAFIRKHMLVLIVIFATLTTLYARYCFRDFISGDMEKCLLVWFKKMSKRGGLKALKKPVGNYNIPYQAIIALFTYLPFKPEYMYKALSVVFDYLMGWTVAQLIYDLTRERVLQVIGYVATVALPIVVLNSAAWGQCDSIYTFFCVLSLLLLLRERYLLCFMAFGAAFAFKLQAVFLLPFFMFVWLYRERFSIWHFALIPIVDIVLSLPGLIAGRKLNALVTVYVNQTNNTKKISWNYPSFWNLLQNSSEGEYYSVSRPMAIITVMLILLCMLVLLVKKSGALSEKSTVEIAFVMTYTCVLFLPSMHERYSYLYVILGLVISILNTGTLPAYVGLLLIDMQTYGRYLFLTETLPWSMLAALNLAIYVFYLFRLIGPIVREPARPRQPLETSE